MAIARFSPHLLLTIITKPTAALDEVRESGSWLEAYALTVICTLAAFVLTLPAQQHLLAAMPTGDLKSSTVGSAPIAFTVAAFLSVIGPPIGWVVEAALLRIAVGIGRGETSLPRLYALIAIAGVPASIGVLLLGIAVSLHDPSTYHNNVDVALTLPITAATLVHRTPQEANFFGAYGIFNVWSYVLIAIGLVRGAKLSPIAATLTMLALSLGVALARAQLN